MAILWLPLLAAVGTEVTALPSGLPGLPEPKCLVHGMAYSQDGMAKTPNGAFVAAASACQSSCSVSVFCHYFTWYNDSSACWLFGDQATLSPSPNATSGPRSCGEAPVATTPAAPGLVTLPPVENASISKVEEAKYKEVVEKCGTLASVVKEKTKDPKVSEDAEKVIAASRVGTLPDTEAVYSVLNEASATLPLEEAEKEGVVVTTEDLEVINKEQRGSLERAEEGVSYGVGAPWTDAVVPYCFQTGTNVQSIQNSQRAMAVINQMVPGIQFKSIRSKGDSCEESPSLLITDREQGCWADIGMKTTIIFGGSQKMNVPPICTVGVVLHELLHAMGMAHEQARPDRDKYVQVLWQNIRSGMQNQFDKMSSADTNRPYDLTSLMHYGSTAFTKNGMPTLVLTAQGQAMLSASGARAMGQREGLSQMDFEQLVHLYNCQMDASGRYTECSPRQQADLLTTLLIVFGCVLACGCVVGGVCCYMGPNNVIRRMKGLSSRGHGQGGKETQRLIAAHAASGPPMRLAPPGGQYVQVNPAARRGTWA